MSHCLKEYRAAGDRLFPEACSRCAGSNSHNTQKEKFQLSTKEKHVQEEHNKHCNLAPERRWNLHPYKSEIYLDNSLSNLIWLWRCSALRSSLSQMTSRALFWFNVFKDYQSKKGNNCLGGLGLGFGLRGGKGGRVGQHQENAHLKLLHSTTHHSFMKTPMGKQT